MIIPDADVVNRALLSFCRLTVKLLCSIEQLLVCVTLLSCFEMFRCTCCKLLMSHCVTHFRTNNKERKKTILYNYIQYNIIQYNTLLGYKALYNNSICKGPFMVAAWLSGNVVGRINEVTLRRDGLVLRWVTVLGYIVLVFNQASQANSAWPSLWQNMEEMWSIIHNPGCKAQDADYM